MSNIFQKLGIGIADAGKWIVEAVKSIVSLAVKVEAILVAELPLEKEFVSGLTTVVADVEAFILATDTAVTATGLNFAADSKAYADLLTLISDFKKLAPIVEEALAALKTAEAK